MSGLPRYAILAVFLGTSATSYANLLPFRVVPSPADQEPLVGGQISEDMFDDVIARLTSLYHAEVASLGGNLIIQGNWVYPEFGASAQRLNSDWLVTVYGGVARFRSMTIDSLALVICHELGHHLGGAPKKSQILWTDWASTEGQADYFATAKCFPRYLDSFSTQNSASQITLDGKIREQCEAATQRQNSPDSKNMDRCLRTAEAAFWTYESVRLLMKETTPVSFERKDSTVVSQTNEKHPAPQCRLDTAVAGLLCPKSFTEKFDDNNPKPGACHASFFPGFARPECWYFAGN